MIKRRLRQLHRWIGVFAALQLLAWTISGLYFTLIPISDVRGGFLLDLKDEPQARIGDVKLISPHTLAQYHGGLRHVPLDSLALNTVLHRPIYVIGEERYDAVTGERLGNIEEQTARLIVQARTSAPVTKIQYIDEVQVDDEYRGGGTTRMESFFSRK